MLTSSAGASRHERLSLALALAFLPLGAAAPQEAVRSTDAQIARAGSRPSQKGPAQTFTGQVRIDPLFDAQSPGRTGAALVTFEPGARTAWHTHPLGQRLIVTVGAGRVQVEGGPVREIRPGDVVAFPPNTRHWHGAGPTTAMSHIAVQESLNGSPVTWMEHVTEAQYPAAPATR